VAADGIARGGRRLIELASKRGGVADGLKVVFNAIQASRSRFWQGPRRDSGSPQVDMTDQRWTAA
jgi:hypothetical protein